MGRSYTPKYRIECAETTPKGVLKWESMIWEVKRKGRATTKNLENWRKGMNASFQADGVNSHVSEACGYIPHICKAKIVNQFTGDVVAETKVA